MDAFYASVEVKEEPSLRGKPVVVGGTGQRSVVASASYEARRFGVRSAMPSVQARRLCPDIVFLPANFALYHAYSRQLHEVLQGFTPLVEGIGLDEAFLDVTGSCSLFGPPEVMARSIRDRVGQEVGLPCAVGVGPNKLISKLASKAAKPRWGETGHVAGAGIVVVAPRDVVAFLWPLPVRAIWGVGRAGAQRLERLGVNTVRELAAVPVEVLVASLGRASGQLLHELAWGRDDRPVVPERAPKSIGQEETYPEDVADRAELERRLVVMSDSVAGRLREHGMVARTVTLKLRYGDFSTLTRSHTFPSPQSTGPAVWRSAQALLAGLPLRGGARLLGVSASGLLPVSASPGEQLALHLAGTGAPAEAVAVPGRAPGAGPSPVSTKPDGRGTAPPPLSRAARPGAWEEASRAMDAVRARFGSAAVQPAGAIGPRSGTARPGACAPSGDGEPA